MEKVNKPDAQANKPVTQTNKPNAPKPNQPVQKPKAEPKQKTKGIGVIIFLLILVLILAGGGGFLFKEYLDNQHEAEQRQKELAQIAAQRDEFLSQLDDLEEAYQKLSLEYSQLESSANAQRATIRRLRAEVAGTAPSADGLSAKQLQERIEELEELLEEYRRRAEMLQSENQTLTTEKNQVQGSLNQANAYASQLEREKREMEEQLEKASILSISNIDANGVRSRRRGDEPTDRARRTDKIQVCFTINQNLVATPGNREFYVRIIDPDNRVLTHLPDDTFNYQGDELSYSANRTINFQNNSQDACLIYDQDDRFSKGYYNIVVFAEGYELGYKLMELR